MGLKSGSQRIGQGYAFPFSTILWIATDEKNGTAGMPQFNPQNSNNFSRFYQLIIGLVL